MRELWRISALILLAGCAAATGGENWWASDSKCFGETRDFNCFEVEARTQRLGRVSLESMNLKERQEHKLKTNYLSDLERLGRFAPEEEIRNTLSRYKTLSDLNSLNSADQIRINVSYHADEKKAADQVISEYGALFVPLKAGYDDIRAARRPWAGYWYPYNAIQSLYGPGSPLQKFDAVLTKLGRNGSSSKFEESRFSALRSDVWEGNCLAWALASISFDEPTGDRESNGQIFSAVDQKALMIRAIDRTPRKIYGIPYRGDVSTDGTFQDIRPEAFHQLVTSILKSGQSVVIDDEAGIEVWSKPVFRYRWQVAPEPGLENAVRVTAYADMVRERHELTNQSTNEKDIVSVRYVYRLYLDKNVRKGDTFSVVAGEWIEESKSAHPDTVTIMAKSAAFQSSNDVLNRNMDLVKSIITSQFY